MYKPKNPFPNADIANIGRPRVGTAERHTTRTSTPMVDSLMAAAKKRKAKKSKKTNVWGW